MQIRSRSKLKFQAKIRNFRIIMYFELFWKYEIFEKSRFRAINSFEKYQLSSNRLFSGFEIFDKSTVSIISNFWAVDCLDKSKFSRNLYFRQCQIFALSILPYNRNFRSSRFFRAISKILLSKLLSCIFISLSYRYIFHLIFGIRHGRCIHRTRHGWNRFDQQDSRGHQSHIRRYLHNLDH